MNLSLYSPGKLLGAICCLWLVGCATKPQIYQWGSYEAQLYARFSANTTPEQQIAEMEKTLHINNSSKPMPPGFHAHLGLLYGELGKIDDMRKQFLLEKQLFPESAPFMDFLLKKAEKLQGSAP